MLNSNINILVKKTSKKHVDPNEICYTDESLISILAVEIVFKLVLILITVFMSAFTIYRYILNRHS